MSAVTGALAAAGWALAVALGAAALLLRARLELVARAEHELRGPATVFALAVERLRREPATRPGADALEVELERLRIALEDLTEARRGRRATGRPERVRLDRFAWRSARPWTGPLRAAGRSVRFDWRAGAVAARADRGRLAQVLGNLLSNAAEHGAGDVEVRGREVDGALRIEVRSSDEEQGRPLPLRREGRGRGLAVAASAAQELGGRLRIVQGERTTVGVLELPADPGAPDGSPRAA